MDQGRSIYFTRQGLSFPHLPSADENQKIGGIQQGLCNQWNTLDSGKFFYLVLKMQKFPTDIMAG